MVKIRVPLKLIVKKKIWLARKEGGETLGWTTEEQANDDECILPGTVLTFDHMYKDAFNYRMVQKGEFGSPEFLSKEVEKFLIDGTFEETDKMDIAQHELRKLIG